MKVRLTIEEVICYESQVIVELPETMSDDEFEEILSNTERRNRQGSARDIACDLEKRFNLKIHEVISSFPESPRSNDLEITDVTDVKK